jgi:hypothetical protein
MLRKVKLTSSSGSYPKGHHAKVLLIITQIFCGDAYRQQLFFVVECSA